MAKLRHHRHYHHYYYYYYRLGAQYKLQVNAIIFRMQFKTGTTPASFSFSFTIFISISLKMWMMARLCCLRLYYKWKFVFIKLCATPDVMAWKIKNYFFPSNVATLVMMSSSTSSFGVRCTEPHGEPWNFAKLLRKCLHRGTIVISPGMLSKTKFSLHVPIQI